MSADYQSSILIQDEKSTIPIVVVENLNKKHVQ